MRGFKFSSSVLWTLGFVFTLGLTASSEPSSDDWEMIETRRIWDQAPHNAFTDLIRYRDHFYCAFREGETHVRQDGTDNGKLRVIRSADGEEWDSVALMAWENGDVRDAKLSITADGRLMLNGAIAFYPLSRNEPRQSITWLSLDGQTWSGPHTCETGVDTWRWSVTWHDGVGYSFGYSGRDERGRIYRTEDGIEWMELAANVFPEGYRNETSIVFGPDDVAYCLLRRDPSDDSPYSAMIGVSQPPYVEWEWRDTGVRMGGPKMIRLEDGRFIAAVRLYDGGARTTVGEIDVDTGIFSELLTLPSGGDTSYAGMVEWNGVLWISYYSSHEERTAIYLAKVAIQ